LVYTTDYVPDETFTILFKRLPYEKAVEFVNIILAAKEKCVLHIEKINENRFDASISLRMKLKDKPDISFTDLSSMVVMEELGITEIITGDEHFIKVGMDFKVLP
jgi:uncharacterized protein